MPLAILCAFVVSIPLTLIQMWEEWDEKRAKKKKLSRDIKAWETIALEKNPVTEPIERGYAVARMLNYAYERECLK